MSTTEVLNFASGLGIPVTSGSRNRAWIKAAYWFVKLYIIPMLPLHHSSFEYDEEVLLNNIVQNATLEVSQDCLPEQFDPTKFRKTNAKVIPARKCFISIKKLHQRCKEPTHGHIRKADYDCEDARCLAEETCAYCEKWRSSSGLLIGFVNGSSLKLTDVSGSVNCCLQECRSEYFNCVLLFSSWNFIPPILNSGKSGCIEVLCTPVVLVKLTSSLQVNPSLIVPVERLALYADGGADKVNISGAFHRLEPHSSSFCLLHLVPVGYRYQILSCYSYSKTSVSVLCPALFMHRWDKFLRFGYIVTITDVMLSSSKGKDGLPLNLQTSETSQLRFVSDDVKLRRLFHQKTQFSTKSEPERICHLHYNSAFCPVFFGRITSVESRDLGILNLDDGRVKMLCFYAAKDKFCDGLRPGTVICAKKSHVCKYRDQTVLACCCFTEIQILHFASDPSTTISWCEEPNPIHANFPQQSRFHPVRLVSWFSLAVSLARLGDRTSSDAVLLRRADSIVRRKWFSKILIPNSPLLTSPVQNKQTGCEFECAVERLVETSVASFTHVSLKNLHHKALDLSKTVLARGDSSSDLAHWNYVVLTKNELMKDRGISEFAEDLVLVAELHSNSSSGSLQLSDGSFSVDCVLTSLSPPRTKDNSSTSRKQRSTAKITVSYGVPKLPKLQSLVRLYDFAVVVEARSQQPLSESEHSGSDESSDSGSNEVDFHRYSTCLVLSQTDMVTLREGPECNVDTVSKQAEVECSTKSETASSVNWNKNEAGPNLLFVMLKTQLLKCSGAASFTLTALLFGVGSEPQERHVQFRDEAASTYHFAYPGMLLEVLTDAEQRRALQSDTSCTINTCEIKIIQDVTDLDSCFDAEEARSFHAAASKLWGVTYFSRGLDPVRRVSDVVVLPTTFGKKRLVAVRGVVTNRIPYKEETLLGFDHLNFRVDLSDDNGVNGPKLSVYIASKCSTLPPLALLPGIQVTFFRVKLIVSSKGFVYCKYTPTSFHIIEKQKLVTSKDRSKSVQSLHHGSNSYVPAEIVESPCGGKDSDHLRNHAEPDLLLVDISRTFLCDIYSSLLTNYEKSIVKLKAQVTRVLSVRVAIVCAACGREKSFSCPCWAKSSKGFAYNDVREEYSAFFRAKAIITDGSGRACLYFAHRDRECFCKLLAIHEDEWNDVVSSLRRSDSGVVSYDCDRHNGKQLFKQNTSPTDASAQSLFVALISSVNCETHSAVEIIARRQFPTKKRTWDEDEYFDDMIGGKMVQSAFKVGTVPLEGGGESSIRSLSLRLLNFNIVTVT